MVDNYILKYTRIGSENVRIKKFIRRNKIMYRIIISLVLFLSLLPSTDMQSQDKVEIPELVGLDLGDAKKILKNIGLNNNIFEQKFTTEDPTGKVLEQYPKQGTQVLKDDFIRLIHAVLKDTVLVSNLVSLNLEEAKSQLQTLGLPMIIRQEVKTAEFDPGTVLNQSLPAGSKVWVGTPIYLDIAIISQLDTTEESSIYIDSLSETEPSLGDTDTTGVQQVDTTKVLPQPDDNPFLFLFYIVLGFFGALAVVLIIIKIIKKKSKRKKPIGTIPDIRVTSKLHFGFQKITQKTMVKADLRVRLKPIPDKGKQNILADDSLILKVSKGESGKENTIVPSVSQTDDMVEAEMQALNSQITKQWQSSKITTLGQLASMLNLNIKLKPVWDNGKQDISVEESLRKKMNIDIK
jgi:hypothetical protein